MRTPIHPERDQRIYQEFKAGAKQATIAARHGLSVIRVAQIVALQKAKEQLQGAPTNG